jgi:transposase
MSDDAWMEAQDSTSIIQKLLAQIEALKVENAKLREENAQLRLKIEELERKQHRPHAPFSSGTPKRDPRKPGRKGGLAHGRHGHRPRPASFDEEHEAPLPSDSPCCGARIAEEGVVEQYQEEIPKKPLRRKFKVHVGHCACCGRRIQGRHPLQTSDALGAAGSTLGADAQALVVHCNKEAGLSYGKIASLFQAVFRISLTPGGASQVVSRAAWRCAPHYCQLQILVKQSPALAMDETGWRVGGILHWLHVAAARFFTLYLIAKGRGFPESAWLIGAPYAGCLTHDGWGPYDKFAEARHGTCNAHLLRRCKTLLEIARAGAVRFPRQVKGLLRQGLGLRERSQAGEISPHGLAIAAGRLQNRFEGALVSDFSHAGNRRFAAHLWKHREQVFAHLRHQEMEATNNQGERAIRPAVILRKVWGGSRTARGADAQAILTSVLRTCVQQGKCGLDFLSEVLRAPPGKPPRLVFRTS